MKTKNAHNYKNLQFIPTWKLKAILEHPNCQGIDGRDYGPVREELEHILFERQNKLQEWELRKKLHGLDRAVREMGQGVKKDSAVKDPAVKADKARGYEIVELIVEIRDFWKLSKGNGGFEIIEIPPQIMAF